VDQAALRAARDSGLEIGGWCPPGRECEAGVIPVEFPLKETERERSPDAPDVPRSQRTEWNVRDSDATLVIVNRSRTGASHSEAATAGSDRGTEWAIECANRYRRPLLVCALDDSTAQEKIREWLDANDISILSIGGPSESSAPGIGDQVYALLKRLFRKGDRATTGLMKRG
jgi:Circularly permutated YpsA SLOG family